ncbi:MAG: D-glycerate dehydrogenase, partial [Geminicoccaceae bacterium]|nr:D-glycerate dehydrogenase [Geminicoccaceae bacterium]
MPRPRPVVIVTRKLPEPIEARMMELFDTKLNETDRPMTRAELIQAVKSCDVLVPTVTDRIDAAILAQAGERLKLIANYGTGVDNIDVDAAYKRGITVTNTPGVLTEDTADMTMALILAVARRLVEGERLARSGEWKGWAPTA